MLQERNSKPTRRPFYDANSSFLGEFQNFSLFLRVTSTHVTDNVCIHFLLGYIVPSCLAARWGRVTRSGPRGRGMTFTTARPGS